MRRAGNRRYLGAFGSQRFPVTWVGRIGHSAVVRPGGMAGRGAVPGAAPGLRGMALAGGVPSSLLLLRAGIALLTEGPVGRDTT